LEAAQRRYPSNKGSDILTLARQAEQGSSPELLGLKNAEESLDRIKPGEIDR
jgi:hypothetical protein